MGLRTALRFACRISSVRTSVEYSDIEVVVEMEGGIRETANLAETLQRPMDAKDGDGR